MKRLLLLTISLLVLLSSHAKVTRVSKVAYPNGKCFLYRIGLKDKGGSPFNINRPEKFLSERSLQRRTRQNIRVDSTDLPVTPEYIRQIKVRGIEVVGKSKWNNTLLIRINSQKDLKKMDDLLFVKYKTRVFSSPDSVTERSRSGFRKELDAFSEPSSEEYGATEKQVEILDGIRLHNQGYRGDGKLIAVFDGGFMNADRIPSLHDMKLAGVADFVEPRSKNIFQEMDHGTMVLSTMAVNVPNYYVGTAPEASYLLVRCEDERTESLAEEDYWAEAAEYADSVGVDIINSSLGYHDFDDKSTNHLYCQQDGESTLISHSASMLARKGIVLVNSAGNDGMGSWKKINFPADAKDILTVGAINSNGENAPFSAIGPTADGRIKPDIMAPGSPAAVLTGRGTIINDMGTSFSSPLVAGLVACLWQALPEKTALQIINLVKKSSTRYSNPDDVYGYGIPDFWQAYQKGKEK